MHMHMRAYCSGHDLIDNNNDSYGSGHEFVDNNNDAYGSGHELDDNNNDCYGRGTNYQTRILIPMSRGAK